MYRTRRTAGRRQALVPLVLLCCLTAFQPARAFELTGAWATGADRCGKVFARKGRANDIGLMRGSASLGGGFVVEATRLRGILAECTIKSKKEDGQTINLMIGCGSDPVLSNVQVVLKVLDDNRIARIFPGVEETGTTFYRCRI